MPFRLRTEARKWFSEIDSKAPLKSLFDLYYFCLMAGLITGRRNDPSSGGREAPEFIDYFIDDYKPAQRLIIGLLTVAESRRLAIDLEEKQAVRELVKGLVDPNSSTNLTDEGLRLLNSYASGGYDHISEQRDTKPYRVEEFLRDFVELIGSIPEDQTSWGRKLSR